MPLVQTAASLFVELRGTNGHMPVWLSSDYFHRDVKNYGKECVPWGVFPLPVPPGNSFLQSLSVETNQLLLILAETQASWEGAELPCASLSSLNTSLIRCSLNSPT